MVRAGALLLLTAGALASPDLQRARAKVPGASYRGAGQTAMSQTLNGHLRRAERTLPCDDWSVEDLQKFMSTVLEHRNEALQEVYEATADRRSVQEGAEAWQALNAAVAPRPHLHRAQREAHCREAVMQWVHHLDEPARAKLRASNVTVPELPEGEKAPCDHRGEADAEAACLKINEKNSCDWCHSSQADHDAGVPGTSVPNALNKTTGPDDGNPHGWDRLRRCDQDQMPRCQLCEGVGGRAWSDKNEDIDLTPCEIVADAKDVDPATVAPPLYPKKFTVRRKDGKQGGYSDTLIGWKTDPFCFGFFPQNDSIPELCYRSEDALVKYYDITRQAERAEYTIHNSGIFGILPNTSATILQVNDRMWIMNKIALGAGMHVNQCVCADPSGNHCENPPCHTYIHRWDTFETAQYLGREKIGVEWIQDHGTGDSSKMMELDHFILWAHHVWTDPETRRIVRAWKPFNGLQVYDPEAWVEDIVGDADDLFEAPPAFCKKGAARVRINCDDDGNYHPKQSEGLEYLQEALLQAMAQQEMTV